MRFVFRSGAAAGLVSLACFACAPCARAQVTLDFNYLNDFNSSNGYVGRGYSLTQNGFTVLSTDTNIPIPGLRSVTSNGGNFGFNYTGSVALYNTNFGESTALIQNNGNTFTLNSIDIANEFLQASFPGTYTITFIGKIQGGGTVTQTYTTAANNALQTVVFGGFTNLTSVSFLTNLYQFDNIRVTPTAVPEPGSVALIVGISITGANWLARKHRK